jgi:GMP synthase-like glutamine amidotransferase
VVVEDIEDPEVGATFPDDTGYDLVVLMGSPWSVYDPRVQGWVGPELEFLRQRVRKGAPTLGICFGAQAISAALGGKVARSTRPEHGWGSVVPRVDQIAASPWFQFHHDEFTTPPGAVELASNDAGVQAFRHLRTLAVQFHPEISADLLRAWCEAGADRALREAGLDPDEVLAMTQILEAESQPGRERLLDWFLNGLADG